MNLRIASKFQLPPEAITETFAILAKRGVGKTYTAKKLAEQMLKANIAPVVIADPIGVWWGLRSSADGKAGGLPVLILGGDYADAPLETGSGELVARMVVEERLSVVLDLSKFRKGEAVQFMTAFSETLYHRNREPLHLMLDEADAFAPQRPMPGEQRLLGAVEDLVRRGRARGIGVTLITQRAAVINKDVLTQAEVLVALRTIAPQDRAAIESWIRVHGTKEQGDELMASLPSLPVGTAWFWSPGWLDVFERVEVEAIETFDSSATPKAGKTAKRPKQLAAVDIAAVKERLAAQIERAKADDPRALRARIAELEKAAREKPASASGASKKDIEAAVVAAVRKTAQEADGSFAGATKPARNAIARAISALRAAADELEKAQIPESVTLKISADLPNVLPATASAPPPGRVAPRPPARVEQANGRGTGAELRVLKALAQRHPMRVTRKQLATLVGMSAGGGTFGTYFSRLKTAGYIAEESGLVGCTDTGVAAANVVPSQPQSTAELVEMWRRNVGGGAARMLDVLVANYPGEISRNELAEKLGMAAGGGTFGTYLSRLRSNNLAEVDGVYVRASATLFDIAGGAV